MLQELLTTSRLYSSCLTTKNVIYSQGPSSPSSDSSERLLNSSVLAQRLLISRLLHLFNRIYDFLYLLNLLLLRVSKLLSHYVAPSFSLILLYMLLICASYVS